ncbi:MAG TPA: class III extradiol ring-cleavage dioxygenase [Acidimicrobiia bacterium]|nr:class III extradiol ring-cleavage dioxygenase [Acidimicrobiia bacterium]
MSTSTTIRMPAYFVSHGGGPWPWLTGPVRDAHALLEETLRSLPSELPEVPKAILMISGHWEARTFTVQTNPKPGVIYDFGGFPAEAYRLQYPAPGSPALAGRVVELLSDAGINVAEDPDRGFDHGMYSALAPAWPDAEIPVVQLSIKHGYDPDEHLAVGRALAPLRDEGVLILGSGATFHNFGLIGRGGTAPSREFDEWLGATLIDSGPSERTARLRRWDAAPSGRTANPQEDHLIPLMVVVGAAEDDPAVRSYHEHGVLGVMTSSSFRFDTESEGAAHV